MAEIKVAFWNVQNLFDTIMSEIAADLEYTPENGWTDEAYDRKVERLAEIIRQLHEGEGADLLGLCEVENKGVVEKLLSAVGRSDYQVAHLDSPDIRGIDTTLVYSDRVFKKPRIRDMVNHLVYLRYPTRDIFQVLMRLRRSEAEVSVLVNHWPSRKNGQYESEPARITVAEHAGRIVDDILKHSRLEYLRADPPFTLDRLNERWNRNVLLMGDLNDEPYSRSVLEYLQAGKDLDHIEEAVKGRAGGQPPSIGSYLGLNAWLFNAMWPQLAVPDRGTHFYSGATNSMNLLDQFIVSRGLLYGRQGLRFIPESVRIFAEPPLASGRGRPIGFDKTRHTGCSDHFPITAKIEVL